MACTDIELTAGQYRTLVRLTHPHFCQTDRITDLRSVLENAQPAATSRYAVKRTPGPRPPAATP